MIQFVYLKSTYGILERIRENFARAHKSLSKSCPTQKRGRYFGCTQLPVCKQFDQLFCQSFGNLQIPFSEKFTRDSCRVFRKVSNLSSCINCWESFGEGGDAGIPVFLSFSSDFLPGLFGFDLLGGAISRSMAERS